MMHVATTPKARESLKLPISLKIVFGLSLALATHKFARAYKVKHPKERPPMTIVATNSASISTNEILPLPDKPSRHLWPTRNPDFVWPIYPDWDQRQWMRKTEKEL